MYWQKTDRITLKKINQLIQDCLRNPYSGLGKVEFLKENLSGYISRRIDKEHRLVYTVYEDRIHIISCRYHY